MNGRDGSSEFLPLDSRIGEQSRDNHPTVGQYLTREQMSYIYKKVETGEMINTNMIKQEIEQERELSKIDDTSRETNPYKELIVSNAEKIEPLMTQMEQWSILSNILNYVQHSRFHLMNHTLDVKAVNKYKSKPNTDDREFKELDFGTMPQKLQEEYMDIYEGVHSEIVSSSRFDENSDISTTYLGRVEKGNQHKLKAEESFPISENGYTLHRLLDGTECQLLLDTGVSKSFMSKSFYMQITPLFAKIASKTQRIQVGNSQCVSVLFIIPVIVDIHRHRFEIYTLVFEIHENVDLVLGIKNVFELEGVFKYREMFSLRDKIGTCLNLEVEIDVTDKSPFFIRPYHVREEDKAFIDKEMKWLCYMGILKEGFSAYSSPVMLISRKLTKDKRVVTDFRLLNMRIAKNNLAYPLVRDTFSVLGNSKCEVLSVLDLKDAFHSLRLSENSKRYCGILPYFGSSSYLYQRIPMGLNISPSI